ncbi:DUF1871 family protein [Pseudobacillus wudalianchiensis]|uniref:DUF1871 domain-containing protein n=1 Tax=Pseudobacillus wudalianchiensis TaxID=1743143 RepID=A0A1B9B916_9BACI|nr:DUF1871 family protein [Bacillus wudalianchiensis]OCA92579.1 hypothetical protein A8F95_02465 [Bacillus wudalianchiensis]
MVNKFLKDNYKKTFTIVEEIINQWDPLDLLAIDCPCDEYEFEIRQVAAAALRIDNAEELVREITEILYKAFDEDFKKSKDCLEIANKITNRLIS